MRVEASPATPQVWYSPGFMAPTWFSSLAAAFAVLASVLVSAPAGAEEADDAEWWWANVRYARALGAYVRAEPDRNAKLVTTLDPFSRVLVITDTRNPTREGWVRVVHPVTGYSPKKHLMTDAEMEAINAARGRDPPAPQWGAEVAFVDPERQAVRKKKGVKAKRVGRLTGGDKVLLVLDDADPDPDWSRISYPYVGWVQSDHLRSPGQLDHAITVLAGVSALARPVERNLDTTFVPLGGLINYSPGFGVSIQAGYLYRESAAGLYSLRTHNGLAHLRYGYRLFDDTFELYVFAGAAYWDGVLTGESTVDVVGYEVSETDAGFSFSGGGGVAVTFANVVLAVQGHVIVGPVGHFGRFEIFPGSNQLDILAGYRFQL